MDTRKRILEKTLILLFFISILANSTDHGWIELQKMRWGALVSDKIRKGEFHEVLDYLHDDELLSEINKYVGLASPPLPFVSAPFFRFARFSGLLDLTMTETNIFVDL